MTCLLKIAEREYVKALNNRKNVKKNGGNIALAEYECKRWAYNLSRSAKAKAKREIAAKRN